ncbi:thioredoxin family protein [Ottowia sp.]|jgi:small redox-active disulfide protein 2|uniref:thioredoxin family protein n=1 Tax=Ottowia sp. TaxID=1898956 RepID=UPI002C807607|nr:thioredoxin family protein [Ottowia sp.]HRN74242.1 thioredoxin family protein [Ottowia sp.]HRQ01398.1 thioredoxin family protein [Ottowia sp.]
MKIEILGSGCKRCIQLGENAQAALAAAGKSAELLKVTNPAQIALRGVMSTPGLAIDGKLVSTGRVLTPEEIGKLLP